MKRNAFFSAEQMVVALASAPNTAVQDASNPGTHAADWDNAIVSHSLGELLFLGLCCLRGITSMTATDHQ